MQEYLRIASEWDVAQKMRIGLTMSSLLGEGMKREIAHEHPDWPARKVSLEVGRLNWGWEVAPPLYGPLEEEARARGESRSRRAEFLASWRLDPVYESMIMKRIRRRSLEMAERAPDQLINEEPCG
ncbi:MAG TPA: hypothetical protein VFQ76_21750 [Longimicrobiaceae bacterium]|nr:hypothetical protein [Longimicrobiaceae bacterium]